jgi:replication-associated recombination protein RarA
MHAFLIIGKTDGTDLAKKIKAKLLPYTINKIEDVRNLNNFTRLSLTEKTLIFVENINDATPEALNAFLKNLEEPQENLYYALTSPSIRKVLPTIVSRCQIINAKDSKHEIVNEDQIKEFLGLSVGQRLAFFDKIRGRDEALEFTQSLIFFLHEKRDLTNMELLLKTLTRLKANGNVNLHLTNLAIKYGK